MKWLDLNGINTEEIGYIMVKKYRKKPVVIEAIKYTKENYRE